ncbi:MAG: hypothetical protein FMNOHCHN_03739 [Ignavibacteriaceae bacterium]|nr:hypothetical protein [Ignavibacteriaceae bacterium]
MAEQNPDVLAQEIQASPNTAAQPNPLQNMPPLAGMPQQPFNTTKEAIVATPNPLEIQADLESKGLDFSEQSLEQLATDPSLPITEQVKYAEKLAQIRGYKSDLKTAEEDEKQDAALTKYRADVDAVNQYNEYATRAGLPTKNLPDAEAYGVKVTKLDPNAPTKLQEDAAARKVQEQQALAAASQKAQVMSQQKAMSELDSARAAVQKELDDIKAIDPERFWNNKTTGQKIMAGIGLFLGGFAAGVQGSSENIVLKNIMEQISNDINAQKLTNEQKLIKSARALDIIQNKINDTSNRIDNDLKKAQISKIYTELEAEKNRRMQMAAAMRMANSGEDVGPALSLLDKDLGARYVPNFGIAKDAESAKKVTTAAASRTKLLRLVNEMETLNEQYGNFEVADRSAVGKAQALKAQMITTLKELENLGASLTGTERDLIEDRSPDVFDFFTSKGRKQALYEELRQGANAHVQGIAEMAGVRERVTLRDQKINELMMTRGLTRPQASKIVDSVMKQGANGK